MRHRPHLYLAPPWAGAELPLDEAAARHIFKVLRMHSGDAVSYTDGAGNLGEGVLTGSGVARGDEHLDVRAGGLVTVAVAAPKSPARQRFIVEKLAELGIDRLVWVATARGEGRPPRYDKSEAWAVGALEQSRRSRLMRVEGPMDAVDVAPDASRLVAAADGVNERELTVAGDVAVFVGPEGGFTSADLPGDWQRLSLSDGVLRVETAAVLAGFVARRLVANV